MILDIIASIGRSNDGPIRFQYGCRMPGFGHSWKCAV